MAQVIHPAMEHQAARRNSPEAVFLALVLAAFLAVVAFAPDWFLGAARADNGASLPAAPAAEAAPVGASGLPAIELAGYAAP